MPDQTQPQANDQQDNFEAELPLPLDELTAPKIATPKKEADTEPGDATIQIVRQKLGDAYSSEPSINAEEAELSSQPVKKLSRHQKFVKELAESGKSLPDIQQSWHEYYAGLPEVDKLAVWKEFESLHRTQSTYQKEGAGSEQAGGSKSAYQAPKQRSRAKSRRVIDEAMRKAHSTAAQARKFSPKKGLRSLGFGISLGVITVIIFLFSFFNERFIAPLIQPSRNAINISIITSGAISADPELIIPKINLEVPVIYGVDTTNQALVQKALQSGVVHYADTALPGQDGNLVIVGHSSNNILNPGKYKFAFVLLHQLQPGDTFYLQKGGRRYIYQVYKRLIVSPTDTSVLGPQDQPATASLITCDPPGTSTNRLVVIGEQISPSIARNKPRSTTNSQAVSASILPGNSPSLWSRLSNWLSH